VSVACRSGTSLSHSRYPLRRRANNGSAYPVCGDRDKEAPVRPSHAAWRHRNRHRLRRRDHQSGSGARFGRFLASDWGGQTVSAVRAPTPSAGGGLSGFGRGRVGLRAWPVGGSAVSLRATAAWCSTRSTGDRHEQPSRLTDHERQTPARGPLPSRPVGEVGGRLTRREWRGGRRPPRRSTGVSSAGSPPTGRASRAVRLRW
jgi:hypothetical protein